MEFRVLGPLEVVAKGEPLLLGPPQQRAVLALLLINANEVVSTDRLIDGLWGATPPASAKQALRLYISRLRRLLQGEPPSLLVTRRPGYVLEVEAHDLDSRRFEDALARARETANPAFRERLLHESLQLWRGRAYADFTYEDFAAAEIHRLEELRLEATDLHIQAELELGHHGEVIGRLEQLIAENPLRESLRGSHMLALYRAGRQAEALRAYQDLRRLLGDELGIEPAAELRRLEDQILLHDPVLDEPEPAARYRNNLPTSAAGFVGRREELTGLAELVARQRMVTLTGPPGVGKTRLALEVASQLVSRFGDGVWLVELGQLTEPDHVAPSIASMLAMRGDAGGAIADRLGDYLRGRRLLIVLDNCEHLVDAAAEVVAAVIPRAAGVHVLATSRQLLRVGGEFNFPLAPMLLPSPHRSLAPDEALRFDVVELFQQRATAAHPGFRLGPDNVEAVVRLCWRLDGIPLAIELAAARVRTLSIDEIVSRLDDRFGLLSQGERGAPAHHRTLEEAIAWSYDLASPGEQRVFRLLSVFSGGFTGEAATAVAADSATDAGAVIDTLAALVDKSLVAVDALRGGGIRYRLLETLRAYAQDRLDTAGEVATTRDRHRSYFVSLAATARQHLEGPQQVQWVNRLAAEQDNLRAAMAWSLEGGEAGSGLRLASELGRFWSLHGDWTEGRGWLERLLGADAAPAPQVLASAHHGAGTLALLQNDVDPAAEHLTAALELFRLVGDVDREADTLNNLASLAVDDGRLAEALHLFDEALAAKQRAGTSGRGMLINLGWLALEVGDHAQAGARFESALAASTTEGDVDAIAWSRLGRGVVAWLDTDLAAAGEDFDACADLWGRLEAKPTLVYALVGQALVARDLAHLSAAARRAAEALELARSLGGGERYAFSLGIVVSLLAAAGRAAEAARLGTGLAALAAQHGWPIWSWFRRDVDGALDAARSALGAKALADAERQGEALAVGDAMRLAREAAASLAAAATPAAVDDR